MTSRIIHFDTINGDDQPDDVYSSRTGTTGQTTNLSHNFFTRIPLVNPLYLVSNIELSSMEFSNTIYNVRSENTSNSILFNFLYQGLQNNVSVVLTPKNYTNIADLLVDINSAIVVQITQKTSLAGFSIILSINPRDIGKIIIRANCDTSSGAISIGESILSRYNIQ